jgi:hypothetical protein
MPSPSPSGAAPAPPDAPSIWWWAFGYFACYVPYSALTRLLSGGGGRARRVGSLELLPVTALAASLAMLAFLALTGWWRHAGRRTWLGRSIPSPGGLTLLSGLCSAGIIATTTLAYSLTGVSMVLVALLMRGGVLVLAPGIDLLTGRPVKATSWLALALSLAAVLLALSPSADPRMTAVAALDLACYLGCYFARLTLMSRYAKASPAANLRYFVEESMVSAPALLALVAAGALALPGAAGRELADGFTSFFARPGWALGLLIGVFSQGTGIFGGLIFLDHRETSFCVPINRASSVLAVLLASLALYAFGAGGAPSRTEWMSAGVLVVALGVLALTPRRPARTSISSR